PHVFVAPLPVKRRRSPGGVSSPGRDEARPGAMSLTSLVSATVPSLRQSSRPFSSSKPEKNTTPPASTRERGATPERAPAGDGVVSNGTGCAPAAAAAAREAHTRAGAASPAPGRP